MVDDPDDPIWGKPSHLQLVGGRNPFNMRPARLPLPKTIPPRRWLYGTSLCREFVSVLVAPGGTGKSLWALSVAAAIASGRELFGDHIFERTHTCVLNLEDPMDELERRLAAVMIHQSLTEDDLRDRIFLHSGDDRAVKIATFDKEGYDVIYPDIGALIAEIEHNNIGLLIVDPFAESHDLEENNNPQMVMASKAWRKIARATHCAILLVHHVRKGAVLDIDSARGAKALTDSARVGLMMSSMSQETAQQFDIPEGDHLQYIRLDDAKANLAPKATEARWFKLETVSLGNSAPNYPNGDRIASLGRWEPPKTFDGVTFDAIGFVLDQIHTGLEDGSRYTASKTGPSRPRWAGNVIIERLGVSPTRAATILAAWMKTGLLFERAYRDPIQRKERLGLSVDASKRPDLDVPIPEA